MKKILQTALLATLITSLVPVSAFAELGGGITYEEKDTGNNMGEAFTSSATVTYGQTPSFSVRIPKSITLDSEGAAKYTVGVKGQIPSKYEVNVIPDETILMEEENNLLDSIIADVTQEKTTWTAVELDPDTYNETTNNTIQMQSIDYGKFEGTLNFNVSAEIPKVELKDASDEVKAANKFVGEMSIDDLKSNSVIMYIPDSILTVEADDIVYIVGGERTVATETFTLSTGYYKCTKGTSYLGGGPTGVQVVATYNSALKDVEYLGESYLV